MWVRRSAIRPVPSYARVGRAALDNLRNALFLASDESPLALDEMFEDFEARQPILADHVGEVLSRPLGDAAVALGYFLSLSIWAAFDRTLGTALDTVSADELRSTAELFSLDQDLRQAESSESLETDDVVAMEQPALVEFVNSNIESTLDAQSGALDADDLAAIYRMLLIEILVLSYAVRAPAGFPVTKSELLA